MQLLRVNPVACVWFLRSLAADADALARRLYNESSVEDMRNATANLAATAIRVLIPLETAGPTTPAEQAALASAPVTLRAGAIVDWFVETLLDALPRLHNHWLRFSQYFQLISSTANLAGPEMRSLFLRRGAIGRFVDFALSGRSLHPELNDPGYAAALACRDSADPTTARLALTATPEVRTMGSNYRDPDFEFLVKALGILTLSSASLAGLCDGPGALPPQLPLAPIDAAMLSSRQFIHAIAQQLKDHSTVPLFTPLIHHLLWGADLDSWTPPPPAPVAVASNSSDSADTVDEEDVEPDTPAAFFAASERLEKQLPLFGANCIVQVRISVFLCACIQFQYAIILQQFAAAVARGIRDADYEDLKEHFRLAGIILDAPADPETANERAAFVMSQVVSL